MKNNFFLILSPSEWSDNAVSNMQISAILSKNNKVVYVETIGTRLPKISEWRRVIGRILNFFMNNKIKKNTKGLDPLNVKIISPLAIPFHKSNFINKVNVFLIRFQLRKFLKTKEKIYIWSFSPIWENFINTIPNKFRIFHCVDALHTYDDTHNYQSLFYEALKKSDVVFTPGILLEQELIKHNSKTYMIGHGCGPKHLEPNNSNKIPEDIKNLQLNKKIVVYAGTLANWVDYKLLNYLASSNHEITFLIIGYIHPLAPIDEIKEFLENKNVIHLGYKNYDDLPSYYAVSSLGIIPYQSQNEHIQYSTPTKFFDYFSAGLQTVSTDFPAAHVYDEEFVKIAESKEEFLDMIESALIDLNADRSLRIKEYAKEHSWDNQVKKMCKIINQVENNT